MSAALALETELAQSFEYERPHLELVPGLERAVILSETAEDEPIRQEVAHFMGQCLANQAVSVEYIPRSPVNSLYEAIKLHAEEVVRTNVKTDVIERTLKSGHVSEVPLTVEGSVIHQAGQSLASIQANNLLYTAESPKMKGRGEAETRNAFRITNAYHNGYLENNNVVVISRVPDNMTEEELQETGFFTDTMSVSIQVTRNVDGQLITESAFVAGTARPGEERHDAETVIALGDMLGVDLRGKSTTELIDSPLLVPNSLMPNGVIDLVELYDDCAETEVFFGEAKPKQDYLAYREKCRAREAKLQPIVTNIVTEILDNKSNIHDEVEACELLAELSEAYMVVEAVNDKTINPLVFGSTAAGHIEEARYYAEIGEHERAVNAVTSAQETAESYSCPAARRAAQAAKDKKNGENNDMDSNEKDEYGSLVFTCGNGHYNRRPRNRLIPKCTTCGISVRC